MKKIAVIGGGAAGFFGAIQCARKNPEAEVTIYEKGFKLLTKVLVSGGGRCNVTHACYVPRELASNYPRGQRELLGPFSKFQPKDTLKWFEAEGVPCHTEEDKRIFPTTNESKSIADALINAAKKAGVQVKTRAAVTSIEKNNDKLKIKFAVSDTVEVDCILLASGSAPQAWQWTRQLGHSIVPPVPSLFTFAIKDPRIEGLSGVSVKKAVAKLSDSKLSQVGPILITHWGLSGPAILKLSAWGAREFHERDYETEIEINWINRPFDSTFSDLKRFKQMYVRKKILGETPYTLPKRLWEKLLAYAKIPFQSNWADLSNEQLKRIAMFLTESRFQMTGKSTFKDEFVTCGGIKLSEVDFRTMESRVCPGLYFAGEVLDVDAVTGGFNFQNAWTTAWVAANGITEKEANT